MLILANFDIISSFFCLAYFFLFWELFTLPQYLWKFKNFYFKKKPWIKQRRTNILQIDLLQKQKKNWS